MLFLMAVAAIGLLLAHDPRQAAAAAEEALLPQTAGRLSYGTTVTGSINPGTPTTLYSFSGIAGDLVNVQVVGMSPNMTPAVSLLSNTQERLTDNNNDVFSPIMGDASLSWFLPYTGLYLIQVSDVFGQAVDFVLRLDGRPDVPAPLIEANVPIRVEIEEGSGVQFYRFTHLSECFSTLTIIPETPEFPFTAHVRSAKGQSVAILRGPALREDRVTIPPDSGDYEIEVGVAEAEVEGSVVLVITCAEDAPFCDGAADLGTVDLIIPGGRLPSTPPPPAITPTVPVVTRVPVRTETEEPAPNDCGGFRLTSPTDGLPNGGVTVYWDPAPSATSYQAVVINNDAGTSTGASTGAGVTNVGLDVGQGALGDGFNFTVRVLALNGDNVICSDQANMLRVTPIQEQDDTPGNATGPFCGDDICQGAIGEDFYSCPADCSID